MIKCSADCRSIVPFSLGLDVLLPISTSKTFLSVSLPPGLQSGPCCSLLIISKFESNESVFVVLGNQKTVTRLLLRTDNCFCALGSGPGTEASPISILFCHKSCGEGSKARGQTKPVYSVIHSSKSLLTCSCAALEGIYCGHISGLSWVWLQVYPPHHKHL